MGSIANQTVDVGAITNFNFGARAGEPALTGDAAAATTGATSANGVPKPVGDTSVTVAGSVDAETSAATAGVAVNGATVADVEAEDEAFAAGAGASNLQADIGRLNELDEKVMRRILDAEMMGEYGSKVSCDLQLIDRLS